MMNKSSKIKSALLQAGWGFGSCILLISNWYISLYPDKVRKDFGDRFMDWYSQIPAPLIGLILATIFMGFVVFEFYQVGISGQVRALPPLLGCSSTSGFRHLVAFSATLSCCSHRKSRPQAANITRFAIGN